jgi:hypothetical protein
VVTKEDIFEKIEKEVKDLDEKVNNFKMYNAKAFLRRSGLRTCLVIRKTLPFFVASFIAINLPFFKSNMPFIRETRTKGANIAIMDSSNGFHEEYTSFSNDYDYKEIHYSSAWNLDEYGLYTRTVQVFKFDDSFINEYSQEELFNMPVEEISKLLILDTTKKVTKTKLTNEDFIYKEPAIVIFNNTVSSTLTVEEKESVLEDIFNTLFYFILGAVGGLGLDFTANIIFKRKLQNKLKDLIVQNRSITPQELDSLRQKLQLHQENLELLQEESPIPRENFEMRKRVQR